MNNNKLIKIIKILVIIFIIICLAFAGYYAYRKMTEGNNHTQQIKVQHGEANDDNQIPVVLNEEDVKNWLNNHSIIAGYFILAKNDFNIETADIKEYSDILGWSLMFGGLFDNILDNKTLDHSTGYDYQYTYSLDLIKNLLKDYFDVGIEKIDVDLMNIIFKNYALFTMNEDTFIIKAIATEADIYNTFDIIKMSLNNDNNIVVTYELKDCSVNGSPDNCKQLGNREIVLKKTTDGYNLLKAYKVD